MGAAVDRVTVCTSAGVASDAGSSIPFERCAPAGNENEGIASGDWSDETQRAVASLRDLLEHPATSEVIEHRQVPATLAWYQGAVGEIVAMLSAHGIVASGPPGGV